MMSSRYRVYRVRLFGSLDRRGEHRFRLAARAHAWWLRVGGAETKIVKVYR